MTYPIEKVNGLSSKTKFYSYYNKEGSFEIEFHEHPDTHELVIMRTWYVPSGEDDVDHDFEIEGVYSSVACELAKLNAPFMKEGKHFRITQHD